MITDMSDASFCLFFSSSNSSFINSWTSLVALTTTTKNPKVERPNRSIKTISAPWFSTAFVSQNREKKAVMKKPARTSLTQLVRYVGNAFIERISDPIVFNCSAPLYDSSGVMPFLVLSNSVLFSCAVANLLSNILFRNWATKVKIAIIRPAPAILAVSIVESRISLIVSNTPKTKRYLVQNKRIVLVEYLLTNLKSAP